MKTTFLFLSTISLFFEVRNITAGPVQYVSIPLTIVEADTASQKRSDAQLLIEAYNTGIYEVKASKLARRQTGDRKVRKFAVIALANQEAMNKDLSALLIAKGLALPTVAPADLKEKFKGLNQLMAKDFNVSYTSGSIECNKKSVALFNHISAGSNDAGVKRFAAGAVAQLQMEEDNAGNLLVYINRPVTSTW
jgi:predicted outer membrane protein